MAAEQADVEMARVPPQPPTDTISQGRGVASESDSESCCPVVDCPSGASLVPEHGSAKVLARSHSADLAASKSKAERLPRAHTKRPKSWMWNYNKFAVAWAINTGTASTAFDLEVFVLGHHVFGIGTSLLFSTIVLSSLVAGANASAVGPWKNMVIAFSAMILYFILFSSAGFAGEASPLQWVFFIPGALMCGSAVAHMGAGYGPWADRTVLAVVQDHPELNSREVSESIVGSSAVISYSVQTFLMAMLAILQIWADMEDAIIILIFGALCLVSVGVLWTTHEPPSKKGENAPTPAIAEGIRLLGRFYKDPRALLLAVYPVAMSCLSSWKTAVISSILKETLGAKSIGVVMVCQTAVTILFAKVNQGLMSACGTTSVLALGAVCCVVGPLLHLFTDLAYSGWWILAFFLITGVAWAVFDTASRAILLEHFPGEMAATAFASLTMQNFSGGAVFYFITTFTSSGDSHVGTPLERAQAWIVVILGLLVVPTVILANRLKPAELGMDRGMDTGKASATVGEVV